MKIIQPKKVITSSHCCQTHHNQDLSMNPNFSITDPSQAWWMCSKWPFCSLIHHQCWLASHSWWSWHHSKTTLCSYSKTLWGSLTYNITKNLSERKKMHLMPKVRSSIEGIIIFNASWSIAVRISPVSEMFEFFQKIWIISSIILFATFYWGMEDGGKCNHETISLAKFLRLPLSVLSHSNQSALMSGWKERAHSVTAYACSNIFSHFFHANNISSPRVSLSWSLLEWKQNCKFVLKNYLKK